ncbi:GntR family transcriptional regulator [Meiothermus hypogaeus]|uniref:GntR family transcriptional regulator n=2 Tax=Meiothermus hypogaeus TaxID=884155 RepID=A0A511R3X8_9DEIN|nr:GntR family transcriptional regulator [Meiothermus hypogaeus]RIH78241.1 HTH-type transcriptional repressor RspR [Meiothermus hypogaeus]GEM84311.1 GntR family transcriptional regulator [Meiothermus hypogaeus NBRC 106114]
MKPRVKLQSERLADKAYAILRTQILKGELPPGHALSVPELSRQLGVSRSPVREAVLQLVADGLAQEEARKGAVVAHFGLEDALQILEAREALEVASVRLGATRATAKDLALLNHVLQAQAKTIQEADLEGYQATDLKFHKLLGTLSHNLVLERMVGLLKDQSHLALESAAHDLAQLERGYLEHQAVLAALEARNAPQAARALQKHFKRIRESLESWLASDQTQPSTSK